MTTLKDRASQLLISDEVRDRVSRLEIPWSRYGLDRYGVSREHLMWFFTLLGTLYRSYSRVTVTGAENIPPTGRAVLAGNHAGGVAVDGGMVLTSLLLDVDPPRLGHSMADKFTNLWPGVSEWLSRVGQFIGVPENAVRLLEDDRLLVVFPEGARGTAKLYWQRHDLVDFGTGFVRLALQTDAPIVPFAFIGAGEAIPTVANLHWLGKAIGAPYVPVTPYLLPLPRPVRCKILFGKALHFEGSGNEADEVIAGYVEEVKDRIGGLIAHGTGRGGAS
jgi:1-acyl-sn-glycerol-3-phosphate acyltransferase